MIFIICFIGVGVVDILTFLIIPFQTKSGEVKIVDTVSSNFKKHL